MRALPSALVTAGRPAVISCVRCEEGDGGGDFLPSLLPAKVGGLPCRRLGNREVARDSEGGALRFVLGTMETTALTRYPLSSCAMGEEGGGERKVWCATSLRLLMIERKGLQEGFEMGKRRGEAKHDA
ncbi:uncharacterized protein SCHCODRAFT_02120598 [Schizophyllum commune H4-8]|uniref:uncharacterized protein n=1 Tax=Schizophyllum commune (strain H4-8 / FGSC 9210) TaxID=578458 RepID=UPI00215F221F|nr:uncharacterized protein SCHCODRAFT_02120598 [Schizophyllum commune H4-8]KAI5885641.1 hypothetical protein SCHCODRAFT_02120598 [Schizophyllum commune H4-8]